MKLVAAALTLLYNSITVVTRIYAPRFATLVLVENVGWGGGARVY